MEKEIYVNIGAEIWISAMLRILKEKGIIQEGEMEKAVAQSIKDFKEGKFTKCIIKG